MAKSSKPLSIFIEKSSSNLFICVFFLVRAMMLPFFTVCSMSIMDQKTVFNQAKKALPISLLYSKSIDCMITYSAF